MSGVKSYRPGRVAVTSRWPSIPAASAGIADTLPNGSWSTRLQCADGALYQAKQWRSKPS